MTVVDLPKTDNLLERLEEAVTENEVFKGVNKFVCCLTKNKGFRCTTKNKRITAIDNTWKFTPFSNLFSSRSLTESDRLGCIAELMYDVILNQESLK